jgi:hypothetical protein
MNVYKYNICLHKLYIGFKQAFDSIDRFQIVEAVKGFVINNILKDIQ